MVAQIVADPAGTVQALSDSAVNSTTEALDKAAYGNEDRITALDQAMEDHPDAKNQEELRRYRKALVRYPQGTGWKIDEPLGPEWGIYGEHRKPPKRLKMFKVENNPDFSVGTAPGSRIRPSTGSGVTPSPIIEERR